MLRFGPTILRGTFYGPVSHCVGEEKVRPTVQGGVNNYYVTLGTVIATLTCWLVRKCREFMRENCICDVCMRQGFFRMIILNDAGF